MIMPFVPRWNARSERLIRNRQRSHPMTLQNKTGPSIGLGGEERAGVVKSHRPNREKAYVSVSVIRPVLIVITEKSTDTSEIDARKESSDFVTAIRQPSNSPRSTSSSATRLSLWPRTFEFVFVCVNRHTSYIQLARRTKIPSSIR